MDTRDEIIQHETCAEALRKRSGTLNQNVRGGFRLGHRQGFQDGRKPDWRDGVSDPPERGQQCVMIYYSARWDEQQQMIGSYTPTEESPGDELLRWYAIPDYTQDQTK